ncbi:hypothetical protein [Baaleninema simplex]|uniref:hypothetical protein n=1 Tax=Baaleninema simplex TaxID=2862350 RepID=UPI0003451BD8|nr:hypothetical protein [Baaleninema simplex]
MEIYSSRQQNLSPQEERDLSALAEQAKRALEDGVVSREERDALIAAIYADGKVSVEECAIFREIQEKIWDGEILIAD